MARYSVGICDVCGSTSKFNNFKPDGWYYGGFGILHCNVVHLGNVESDSGMFCSLNCVKNFIGSYFINTEAEYIDRIDLKIQEQIETEPLVQI